MWVLRNICEQFSTPLEAEQRGLTFHRWRIPAILARGHSDVKKKKSGMQIVILGEAL
jgi:hypothetical protein